MKKRICKILIAVLILTTITECDIFNNIKYVEAAETTYDPNATKTGYHLVVNSTFNCHHDTSKSAYIYTSAQGLYPSASYIIGSIQNPYGLSYSTSTFTRYPSGVGAERVSPTGVYLNVNNVGNTPSGPGTLTCELAGSFSAGSSLCAAYAYYLYNFSYCDKTGMYYYVGVSHSWWGDSAGTVGVNEYHPETFDHVVTEYRFEPNNYNVVYDGNGADSGYVDSQSAVYDSEFNIKSNNYSRSGCRFTGWNTAWDGSGQSYSEGQNVSNLTSVDGGTVTLYAQWESEGYKITFDANGGNTDLTGVTVYYNSESHNDVSSGNPVMDGNTFTGWYTSRTGGTQVYNASGKCTNEGTYWKNNKWNYTGNVTLYAHWNTNSYTLYLDPNGGKTNGSTSAHSVSVIYGSTNHNNLQSVADATLRTGYTFEGWYTSRTGGTQVYDDSGACTNEGTYWRDSKWNYSGDATLYAHWTAKNYTITFNANGGSTTLTSVNVIYDSTQNNNVSSGIQSKTGYTFTGWYTSRTGGVQVYGADGKCTNEGTYWWNNKWQYLNNVTLYAHWTPNNYTITFDGNGGSTTLTSVDVTYDSTNNNHVYGTQTRSGYEFEGWYTSRTGGTKVYDINGACTNEGVYFKNSKWNYCGNLTLYAHWVDKIPPEIKYDPMYPVTPDSPIQPGGPASSVNEIIYDWVATPVVLDSTAEDSGSGVKSFTLYKNETQEVIKNSTKISNYKREIKYTSANEGIDRFRFEVYDNAGNSSKLYITTKIDYTAPDGDVNITYLDDGIQCDISNIVEEHSGVVKAWVVISDNSGRSDVDTVVKQLNLTSGTNINNGSSFSGIANYSESMKQNSEQLKIDIYIEDRVGNRNLIQSRAYDVFYLEASAKRLLGDKTYWSCGEVGHILFKTGQFTDKVEVTYPQEWVALDSSLGNRVHDYAGSKSLEKEETDRFMIPVYAEEKDYIVNVKAYRWGRNKSVDIPIIVTGDILEEIKTVLEYQY